MVAASLEMFSSKFSESDLLTLQAALRGVAANTPNGLENLRSDATHEQVARMNVANCGPWSFLNNVPRKRRSRMPRKPGQAWQKINSLGKELQLEEFEVAEALFDLATVAAMADSRQLGAPTNSAKETTDADAGTEQQKVAAQDVALLSPRKRQRKPSKVELDQRQFTEDEAAAGMKALPADADSARMGSGKIPRLHNGSRSRLHGKGDDVVSAKEASTADSRGAVPQDAVISQAAVHPSLMDPPMKHMTQPYLAHFINWYKAREQLGSQPQSGSKVGSDVAVALRLLQQQQQQHSSAPLKNPFPLHPAQRPSQQAQQLPACPPSPTSMFQQLLASRGLAGRSAGQLHGGLGTLGPRGDALPFSALPQQQAQAGRHVLAPGSTAVGSAAMPAPGPASAPQAQRDPHSFSMPLPGVGLNGLPPIRTHPGNAQSARLPQIFQPSLQQRPPAAMGYASEAGLALPGRQQQGLPMPVAFPSQQPHRHSLQAAQPDAGVPNIPHLLKLLMNHHQQAQQGPASGGHAPTTSGVTSMGPATTQGQQGAGSWQVQQRAPGRGAGIGPLQPQFRGHQELVHQQGYLVEEDASRLLLQQRRRQAQQTAFPAAPAQQQQFSRAQQDSGYPAQQQMTAWGGAVKAEQVQQQYPGQLSRHADGSAASMSKLMLQSETERALRSLHQAIPHLSKQASGRTSVQPNLFSKPAQSAALGNGQPGLRTAQGTQQLAKEQEAPVAGHLGGQLQMRGQDAQQAAAPAQNIPPAPPVLPQAVSSQALQSGAQQQNAEAGPSQLLNNKQNLNKQPLPGPRQVKQQPVANGARCDKASPVSPIRDQASHEAAVAYSSPNGRQEMAGPQPSTAIKQVVADRGSKPGAPAQQAPLPPSLQAAAGNGDVLRAACAGRSEASSHQEQRGTKLPGGAHLRKQQEASKDGLGDASRPVEMLQQSSTHAAAPPAVAKFQGPHAHIAAASTQAEARAREASKTDSVLEGLRNLVKSNPAIFQSGVRKDSGFQEQGQDMRLLTLREALRAHHNDAVDRSPGSSEQHKVASSPQFSQQAEQQQSKTRLNSGEQPTKNQLAGDAHAPDQHLQQVKRAAPEGGSSIERNKIERLPNSSEPPMGHSPRTVNFAQLLSQLLPPGEARAVNNNKQQ